MPKILPISEVKTRLTELVTDVTDHDEVIVTRNGKPAAVLVGYEDYESLKETLEVLCDADLMEQIRKSSAYFAAGGKGHSFEDVFGESLQVRRARRR